MDLKKIFPFSYKVTSDVTTLVVAIAIYIVASAVWGVVTKILGGIPVLGWIIGIVGAVLWVYCIIGIVLSILEYLNAKKQ